jgi:hypothetical protein
MIQEAAPEQSVPEEEVDHPEPLQLQKVSGGFD